MADYGNAHRLETGFFEILLPFNLSQRKDLAIIHAVKIA
jgi:hypothetical protein